MLIKLGAIAGCVDMPKPLLSLPKAEPAPLMLPRPEMLDPSGLAASFEPVEAAGLSMSMPEKSLLLPLPGPAALLLLLLLAAAEALVLLPLPLLLAVALLDAALLLWRRCLLEAIAMPLAAAPGPGAFFGGAAAIGTTPLPPATPVADPV